MVEKIFDPVDIEEKKDFTAVVPENKYYHRSCWNNEDFAYIAVMKILLLLRSLKKDFTTIVVEENVILFL